MPDDVIIVSASHGMNRALTGYSQNQSWTSFLLSTDPPTIGTPPDNGIFAAGHGGMNTAYRLMLVPFSSGGAGTQFSVRVYGWVPLGPTPILDTWMPLLLAEFLCTTAELTGPAPLPGVQSALTLLPTDYLCDTITLTQGSVGPTGEINSTGPGTNLAAFAMLELRGAKFFQFDFQQTDPVMMNCLWSRR